MRDNEHYQTCARVWMRRAEGVDMDDSPETVDAAIKAFGSRRAFKKWADWYIAKGCGIAG